MQIFSTTLLFNNFKGRKYRLTVLVFLTALTLFGCVSTPKSTSDAVKSSGNTLIDSQAATFKTVQIWADRYEADPDKSVNIIEYARALTTIGSDAKALKIITHGLEIHPKDPGILRSHAKYLASRGLYGPALRKMQLALKYSPNNWRIYNDIGGYHSKMNDQALAIENFKRALKINPDSPNIYTNLGVTYMLSKQLPLAAHNLLIAVKHPEATSKMRQNYAFVLGLQGKYDSARKMFLQDLPLYQAEANIAQIKKLNAKK